MEYKFTDHDPILLNIKLDIKSEKIDKKKTYYRKLNHEKFKKNIERVRWDDVLNLRDPDVCTKYFINKLKGLIIKLKEKCQKFALNHYKEKHTFFFISIKNMYTS